MLINREEIVIVHIDSLKDDTWNQDIIFYALFAVTKQNILRFQEAIDIHV